MAQQEQKKFKPLKKEMYSGNKIQIIDFFSGAESDRQDCDIPILSQKVCLKGSKKGPTLAWQP